MQCWWVGGVLASALVPGCGRSALDGADGSRALPEDAGPGEARPLEDAGSTDDAGRADAGMPSRCGLPGPVDLDGDGVPFVEESIVELASGMPEEVFPELVVGGGLTLAAFECPEEPSAPACVSTVVTVDEMGVHRFQEPLAPFPGSGWFTRKDVLVTDDGSGWVLFAGIREAEVRWRFYAFRCGEVRLRDAGQRVARELPTLRMLGPGRVMLVTPDGASAFAWDDRFPLVSDGEVLDRVDDESLSDDAQLIFFSRGDERQVRVLGTEGWLPGRLVGSKIDPIARSTVEMGPTARPWLCVEREGADGIELVLAEGTTGFSEPISVPRSFCSRVQKVDFGDDPRDLWLFEVPAGPLRGRLRRLRTDADGALRFETVLDDVEGAAVLRTEGGWFIATSDSSLWFLAAAGADPAEPTLVPAPGFGGSFDVIGGLVVMLESGAGVRNSRVRWLDGRTGGVFGEWTFPERMLRVVSLDDDRLRVALHARGDAADLTLVELPAGGGPPVTLATRLREVDEVELGRALPSLLATCRRDPEDPTNCALLDLSGEEPTTRSVVDDLTRRPVGLARSSGPGFSDGERFPWVWIRRAGGPDAGVLGRIQGIGTATTVPTFEASLDGVLNPPNVVIDGAGRNWFLVDRGLDTEVRRVDDDGTLPVIAQGRSGRLVSGGGGVVGGLWLEGRGEPSFACVLQPGEGRCEAVPAGIRPLRGRDPLVAPDGRMRVVFVADGDGDGFPDAGRVSFRIWRSRVVDG
jgi:hypothetical protein